MPEITSPFDEPPRKESPGEREQRYAGIIKEAGRKMGFDFAPEASGIARFIRQVSDNLSTKDQQAIAAWIAKVISSVAKANK